MFLNDNKILILGGQNESKGINKEIYTIDLINGDKFKISINLDGNIWSILPIYYRNDQLYLFFTGEEKTKCPRYINININSLI
jgi:hypothetical protein